MFFSFSFNMPATNLTQPSTAISSLSSMRSCYQKPSALTPFAKISSSGTAKSNLAVNRP